MHLGLLGSLPVGLNSGGTASISMLDVLVCTGRLHPMAPTALSGEEIVSIYAGGGRVSSHLISTTQDAPACVKGPSGHLFLSSGLHSTKIY